MERSRFMNQTVLPKMLAGSTYYSLRDLMLLQNIFAANRALSDRHIADWTNGTIKVDWDGYRRAASVIWQMMEQQMIDEKRLVAKYLGGVQLQIEGNQ